MAFTYGYDKVEYDSHTKSEYKWHDPQPRVKNGGADTRASHFSLGDDEVDWSTAAGSTFAGPGKVERAKPIKPSSGGGVMFGNDTVEYKSATSAAYAGGPVEPRKVLGKGQGSGTAPRTIVFGDDSPEYESVTMKQARDVAKGADVAGEARVPDRKRGHGPPSFTFGYEAPEYTSTAASSMKDYGVGKAERASKPAQAAFVFGDDSTQYVSNRMAEEGLDSRKIGQRYKPGSTAAVTGATLARSASGSSTRDKKASSWTLGNDKWEPVSSASADFAWPTGAVAMGLSKPSEPVGSGTAVRSNILLGEDSMSRFMTEARGQFAAPEGGGRQPSSRPHTNKLVFGSDAADYSTSYATTVGADKPVDQSSTLARKAAVQLGRQRSVQLGDDEVAFESVAQAAAQGYRPPSGQSYQRAERVKGTSAASFVLGNTPTEYSTTTGSASALIDTAVRTERTRALPQAGVVFGDDTVEYVSTRMGEEGSDSRKIGQRYRPRGYGTTGAE